MSGNCNKCKNFFEKSIDDRMNMNVSLNDLLHFEVKMFVDCIQLYCPCGVVYRHSFYYNQNIIKDTILIIGEE